MNNNKSGEMSDEDYDYVEEESWIGGFFSGSPKYVLGLGAVLVWFLYFPEDAEYKQSHYLYLHHCRTGGHSTRYYFWIFSTVLFVRNQVRREARMD